MRHPLPLDHFGAKTLRPDPFVYARTLRIVTTATIVLVASYLGGSSGALAATLTEEAVSIDLVDRFDTLRVDTEVTRIDPTDPGHERLFVSGWTPVGKDKQGNLSRWTISANAAVDIPVVHPTDRTLRIELVSFPQHDRVPAQRLEILWNGESLAQSELQLGHNELAIEVPAKLQRTGLNRLEIMPNYWASLNKLKIGSNPASLGVQLTGITFAQNGAAQSVTQDASCAIDGDDLVQAPGSTFACYVALPEKAVLHLPGTLTGALSRRVVTAAGELRIALTTTGDGERLLFTRSLADLALEPDFLLELDLSEWAGRMVGITVSFWADSVATSEPVTLRWHRPRISGVESKLVRSNDSAPERRPNVLVVLFDALRADHVWPYGAERDQTPTLAKLADRGTVFKNSRAATSWTLTSVTSMFTSMYPTTHGVVTKEHTISQELPYLPNIMQDLGYRTLGYSRNGYVANGRGHGRGFDIFHDVYKGKTAEAIEALPTPEARAGIIWDTYVSPFLEKDTDKPFFMYFHEIDPHHPYEPPPPFDTLYTNGYHSALSSVNEVMALMIAHITDLRPADLKYLNALYRGEVTFMDRFLESILDRFDANGMLENTLVVFVSDHGDEFMDHGRLSHAHSLYDELLRVPMIFSLKGVVPEGARISRPVELIDLPPTILELVGAEVPPAMQGESLVPWFESPGTSGLDRPVFGNLFRPTYRLDSVVHVGWKLIRRMEETGKLSYQLFDLSSDPEEVVDLWGQRPVVGRCLQQAIEWQLVLNQRQAVKVGTLLKEEDLDEETRKNLEALGYLN